MPKSAAILAELQEFCLENGIFKSENSVPVHTDLIDSGAVDSMGLVTLQSWIEERFEVSIAPEIFLMELRTLAAISERLAQEAP